MRPETEDKVNILVVDDLADKRLAFRSVLDDLDENLVLVDSGAEALRELLEREFAVIVLDVNMPDIDGIETAERRLWDFAGTRRPENVARLR